MDRQRLAGKNNLGRCAVDPTEQAHAEKKATSGTIFRLIYKSRSQVPADKRDIELGNIFRVARAKNAAQGITGALLLYDDWFAQTLEGDEAAVRSLFARIQQDPRHDAVQVREEGMVATRVFSRWAMAKVGEHGEPDIPLLATTNGVAEAAGRASTPEQDRVLAVMRETTRGYGY
jgi:Sensors of blue-light using FAD